MHIFGGIRMMMVRLIIRATRHHEPRATCFLRGGVPTSSTCNSHITGKFEGVFFSVGMGDGATTPSLVAFIFMKLHYPSPFPADNGPTFGSSEELEPRAKRMGRCDFLSSVLRVQARCCDAAKWVDSREPSHYFFLNHFFYEGYQ